MNRVGSLNEGAATATAICERFIETGTAKRGLWKKSAASVAMAALINLKIQHT